MLPDRIREKFSQPIEEFRFLVRTEDFLSKYKAGKERDEMEFLVKKRDFLGRCPRSVLHLWVDEYSKGWLIVTVIKCRNCLAHGPHIFKQLHGDPKPITKDPTINQKIAGIIYRRLGGHQLHRVWNYFYPPIRA